MLKSILAASLLSVTLLGATAISASADPSAKDCAYAKMNIANGVGASGGSGMHFNPDAYLLAQCK